MRIKGRVKGKTKTISRLNRYQGKKNEGFRDSVQDVAKDIEKDQKRLVPVQSGETRDSITVNILKNGLRAYVGPKGKKAWKAKWVEHGTRERHHKDGKSTGKMPPSNFVFKSGELNKGKLRSKIGQELKRKV